MLDPAPRLKEDSCNHGRESRSLSKIAHGVIQFVSNRLPKGDLAELRRMSPSDTLSAAFFKVMLSCVYSDNDSCYQSLSDGSDEEWAAFIQVAAYMAELHSPSTNLGSALARAGYSELRLFRLLRAQDETLRREVRTCSKFLASKGQVCDLVGFARLLLVKKDDAALKVRKAIASCYYQVLSSKEN